MAKTTMGGVWIDQLRRTQLHDVSQRLERRKLYPVSCILLKEVVNQADVMPQGIANRVAVIVGEVLQQK